MPQPHMSAAAARADFDRAAERRNDVRAYTVIAAACAYTTMLAACGAHGNVTFHDSASGLAFSYPRSWNVTGFSQTTSPQRLVLASYELSRDQVEGDCGGMRALRALPSDGAAVPVIDYGATSKFAPHSGRFRLADFKRGTYECFGETYMARFHRSGRDLQAHVALGGRANSDRRRDALAILDSVIPSRRARTA